MFISACLLKSEIRLSWDPEATIDTIVEAGPAESVSRHQISPEWLIASYLPFLSLMSVSIMPSKLDAPREVYFFI